MRGRSKGHVPEGVEAIHLGRGRDRLLGRERDDRHGQEELQQTEGTPPNHASLQVVSTVFYLSSLFERTPKRSWTAMIRSASPSASIDSPYFRKYAATACSPWTRAPRAWDRRNHGTAPVRSTRIASE